MTIELIQQHVADSKAGKHIIAPGDPQRFSDAASVGDCIPQGDLYLMIVSSVPKELSCTKDEPIVRYARVERPAEADLQLVPGNTVGSRHALDSLDGVELYRPEGWGQSWMRLEGPCFVLSKERTVKHPTHGDVTIPAGFTVLCGYQRSLDEETKRERRNAD